MRNLKQNFFSKHLTNSYPQHVLSYINCLWTSRKYFGKSRGIVIQRTVQVFLQRTELHSVTWAPRQLAGVCGLDDGWKHHSDPTTLTRRLQLPNPGKTLSQLVYWSRSIQTRSTEHQYSLVLGSFVSSYYYVLEVAIIRDNIE
jgi:hypothetical protein